MTIADVGYDFPTLNLELQNYYLVARFIPFGTQALQFPILYEPNTCSVPCNAKFGQRRIAMRRYKDLTIDQ